MLTGQGSDTLGAMKLQRSRRARNREFCFGGSYPIWDQGEEKRGAHRGLRRRGPATPRRDLFVQARNILMPWHRVERIVRGQLLRSYSELPQPLFPFLNARTSSRAATSLYCCRRKAGLPD